MSQSLVTVIKEAERVVVQMVDRFGKIRRGRSDKDQSDGEARSPILQS
jgi:hypothetical protein